MKQFLAIFLGSALDSWNKLDEKTRKEKEAKGIDAWHRWVEKNHKSIVVLGAPLGKTKKADPQGISDTKNAMTAYTVVQAETHEEAAGLFLNHPHFMIFPGDSIEIMECLPIPSK